MYAATQKTTYQTGWHQHTTTAILTVSHNQTNGHRNNI